MQIFNGCTLTLCWSQGCGNIIYIISIATSNILNLLFEEFDICIFLHVQPSYSYFVKDCPLRIFITNAQNFAMLQNLTCITFGGVSVNGIFVICLHFSRGQKGCFVLAGNNFFVIWIYCLI